MTVDRAWFILGNVTELGFLRFAFDGEMNQGKPLVPEGITKEEDEFIRTIWSMMGEDKSYFDAICAIAGG